MGNYKRKVVPPRDHTVIKVERGDQDFLANLFDVAPSTISKYLSGNYQDDNPNIEFIECIRAKAKKMSGGIQLFVARHRDGSLQAFNSMPRRNLIKGIWYDPLDEFNGIETLNIPYPEILLPDNANPDFDKRIVIPIIIKKI